MWPTATAGDARAGGSRNTPTSKAHAGLSLTDAVTTGESTGRQDPTVTGTPMSERVVLNPWFVEALMGFPIGHTDCEPSETPSSRNAPK